MKTIGIVSLKGGVGKTSAVAALGAALADFGKKILLVDANFSSSNLGLHLNIIDPETTLHEVLDEAKHIKDAIVKHEKFDVILPSLFSKKIINPLKLRSKLKNLKNKYDYALIDSSPAMNDETLGAMLASDELFVVTTPDFPTLSNTLKAIKLAQQRGIKINGIILNKVYNKNFEIPLADIEKTTEIPILAVIPHDLNAMKSLFNSVPLTTYKPNSEGSIEYKKLAAALIGEKYKPFNLSNFFHITPKRQEINREVFYKRVFE
ncbi:MAG: AAA family ATPase [archaeon]